MDPTRAVERFCYLGNLKPVYVAKTTKIDCETFSEYSKIIESIGGDQFLSILTKCLSRNNLPRNDELWYIYAVYISSNTKQENKKIMSNALSIMATTTEDLFMFAYYAKQLREINNKKGFSNSVRKAIANWYEKQDVGSFICSITKNLGSYGFTHLDLISLCHVNTSENGLDTVFDYMFKPKKIKLDDNSKSENVAMNIVTEINTYKKTGDNKLMKRLVDEKKLKFHNFPNNHRDKVENWLLILPTMTYNQILDNLYYFVEKKFFDNPKFSKLCINALSNSEAMIEDNIHPISFLFLKNRLDKQIKYTESVKQNYHSKTLPTLDKKVIQNLNGKLTTFFNNSFDKYEGTPLRTLIAINIAGKFSRQSVISQTQVSCFEAAITLALSYYKNKKPSSVYAYSSLKMKKIEWNKKWNYEEASTYCKPFVTEKVLQRLAIPLSEALENPAVYDLFLIIVGSATYGNSNNKPDQLIELLQEYRKNKNPKAKVIIINLRRFRPSMEYEELKSDGILEICGIDKHTINIINAFALNHFN